MPISKRRSRPKSEPSVRSCAHSPPAPTPLRSPLQPLLVHQPPLAPKHPPTLLRKLPPLPPPNLPPSVPPNLVPLGRRRLRPPLRLSRLAFRSLLPFSSSVISAYVPLSRPPFLLSHSLCRRLSCLLLMPNRRFLHRRKQLSRTFLFSSPKQVTRYVSLALFCKPE